MIKLAGARTLPVIYQSEHAECGLACLAMVAAYFGHPIDLGLLRERTGTSSRGMSLNQLLHACKSIGLHTRVVGVEPHQLRQLGLPAILHWDLSHYVVVRRVTATRVDIHDPNRGLVSIALDEIGNHLSGIAIELRPGQDFVVKDEFRRVGIRDLLPKDLKLGGRLVAVAAVALLAQLIALIIPYYFQVVIDRALLSYSFDALHWLTAFFICLVCVDWLVKYLRNTAALNLSMIASVKLSAALLERLLFLPLGYFESRTISGLVAKFDSLDEVRTILCDDAVRLFVDLLMCLGLAVVLFYYSPTLLCWTLLFVGIYILFRLARFQQFRLATEEQIVRRVEQRNHLLQTVHHADVVKANGVEDHRLQQWRDLMILDLRGDFRIKHARSSFELARDGLIALETIVTGYLCFLQVFTGKLSLGMVFAYFAYKRQFVSSAWSLVEIFFKVRTLGIHINHLADVVHTPGLPRGSEGNGQLRQLSRAEFANPIVVDQLSFRFAGEQAEVLFGLSFTVARGSRFVITGPSGVGKTTLIKLLLGLLNPSAGTVRLGEVCCASIERASWLRHVGSVLQGGALFAATIRENIALGADDIDDDRVAWCAGIACIHNDIAQLPMRYETHLGDRGGILSAGQIQRLLIARALYRQPEILIMDEGTANLDQDTEAAILQNLRSLGITTIHAAHRAQVVQDATHVLHLLPTQPEHD